MVHWVVVLAALLCLLVLSGSLYVVHVGARARLCENAFSAPPTRAEVWMGAAFVGLSETPLLWLAPWLHGEPHMFWGDTPGHVRVAAEIARTLLPYGWIDAYLGGFPFGHHYPPLGWLILAALLRAGLPAAAAVHLLGFCVTVAAPLVLYAALLRLGRRPAFACAGAALIGWVAPYNAFVGGYETFFATGLVSQSLALPICVWLVVETLDPRGRWAAPVAVWFAMAAHPQLTLATLALLAIGAAVSGHQRSIIATLRSGVFVVLAAVALYGQGLGSLDIPFGWPPDFGWRKLGFSPSRLEWWLTDGELLDRNRAPVLTALVVAALVCLAVGARRPENRGLAAAVMASVLLGVSGRFILGLGRLGELLLSFLQPLRVLGLVPSIAGACLAFALQYAAVRLSGALERVGRHRLARGVAPGLVVLALGIGAFGLPERLTWATSLAELMKEASTKSCAGDEIADSDYDRDALRSWFQGLSGGKLWYDGNGETRLGRCLVLDGLEVDSAVPIAAATAVGTHVGVLSRASLYLDPSRAGFDRRAEALGVRHVLLDSGGPPPPGFTLRERRGTLSLLELPAASNIGLGCITRRWRGSAEQVRALLNADLATERADDMLDPHRFVALEYAPGSVVESDALVAGCDAAVAHLDELSEAPGVLRARVQSPAPVDVVFRVSAFPTWRVWVDAEPAPTLVVAPGFVAVRILPGAHELEARASLLPHYGLWLAGGALASLVLAAWGPRRSASGLGARPRLPRR